LARSFIFRELYSRPPGYEIVNDDDKRDYQQQVDETTRDIRHQPD
jgi:hypothetical protein